MRRRTVFWVVLATALTGCGGGGSEEPAAAPVKAARSDSECVDLWNADAQPGTAGQTSPADYLIEATAGGSLRVRAMLENGECLIIAPVKQGSRRMYIFVAPRGRAPFGQPSRQPLPAGRDLDANARATADGKLEPLSG